VYITSRAIEEFQDCKSLTKAVKIAVATSGKATTVTAVALAISTFAWVFSNIRFDAEMGLLLGLWMIISYLGAVTILPALLVIVKPKFIIGNLPAEPVSEPSPKARGVAR
jgi:predicted RND superfamily exporter protein